MPSTDDAAALIANDPALLAEARALLPTLERIAKVKAGPEGVKAVIGRRFAYFHVPKLSEAETDAWWGEYIETLSEVGLASLEAAMRAYVALPDSEFMPKAGRLRELSFTTPCRSLQRWHRAKRAIDLADTPKALPAPPADPEAVRKMLAEFQAGHVARTPPTNPNAFKPAKVDAGGLTAEMRELMARRA